jgi:MFS family permease
VLVRILPLMITVFVVFLVTGVALPALPLYVHQRLGLGTFAIGAVAGAQFAASLITRMGAGVFADNRGAKRALLVGLATAATAGLLYLASLAVVETPLASAGILLAGRAVLGAAESLVIVGAQSWGLGLVGRENAGKVISWLGIALYGALAAGAPLGSALYAAYGFAAISLATIVAPIATLALVGPLTPVAPKPHVRVELLKVATAVSMPGIALAFASVGFGVMTAFSVLLFLERGWRPAWLAYTAFAVAFIAARIMFGHLPDQKGGARIAMLFAIVEAAGFAALWASPSRWIGFVGAAVVGFGYSLVYPGLGIEAVRRAPAEARGLAIGVFTAYLDLALGVLLPALGLLAGVAGLSTVFIASAILSLAAAPIAASLATSSKK